MFCKCYLHESIVCLENRLLILNNKRDCCLGSSMIYYDLSPRLELSNPCSFMIASHVLSDLYVFDLHIKLYVVAWYLFVFFG
jgi:hypothetical protein